MKNNLVSKNEMNSICDCCNCIEYSLMSSLNIKTNTTVHKNSATIKAKTCDNLKIKIIILEDK